MEVLLMLICWILEILITIYYLTKRNFYLQKKKTLIFFISLFIAIIFFLIFEWTLVLSLDKMKVLDTWTDTDKIAGKIYFVFIALIFVLTPLFSVWTYTRILKKRQRI